ncbi:MAG: Gfo/Idh/MocA family oxidoreductase, partial [Clostridia bacterium]
KGTRAMDGGGCLINQGIHAIDLMMYLCGDVSSVCAQVGALGRDIEVEDTAAALLAFQNGAQGVIMGTTLSHIPENAPEGDRIRIECARGSILYAEGKTTYYKNEQSDDFDVTPIALDDVINVVNSGSTPENIDMVGHSEIVSNFISAILDEAEVMISAESARRGVDLVLAIYRSADAHGWVDVVYN